jgi:hypothetical protein
VISSAAEAKTCEGEGGKSFLVTEFSWGTSVPRVPPKPGTNMVNNAVRRLRVNRFYPSFYSIGIKSMLGAAIARRMAGQTPP